MIDDETIILDAESGVYMSLNSTASFFFKKLCDGASASEAVDAVRTEFENPPVGFESEFETLVQTFLEKRLISIKL
jgi:hypothetical protein